MRDNVELLPQSPHILNVNIIGAQRKKYGQQFCPECLKDSSYFRSLWRVSALPCCTIHNTLLSDRCPHCGEPVYLTRTTTVLRNLNSCSFCWNHLTTEPLNVSSEALMLIKAMKSATETGWFEFDNIKVYAPLFFKGFWRFIYAFYGTKGRRKKVWEKTCDFFELPVDHLIESRIYNSFKDEPPKKKLMIINVIQKILTDWPNTMIELSHYAKITPLVLDLPKSGMPYWLQKIAEKELNRKQREITLEEFDSALDYLYRHGHDITKAAVSTTLGLDKSKKLNPAEMRLFKAYCSLSISNL